MNSFKVWGGKSHIMKKNQTNKALRSVVVQPSDAAVWRWRKWGVMHYCFGPIFSKIFVTNDCATWMSEGLGSNQLHPALSTVIETFWSAQSKYSKAKPAFSWGSCNGESGQCLRRVGSLRADKMSGVEQNPLLIINESKACNLVSPFSVGCGLSKLPPLACGGDEPQPQCRTSKQPGCTERGIICAAGKMS